MNNLKSLFRLVIKRLIRIIMRAIRIIYRIRLSRKQWTLLAILLLLLTGGIVYRYYYYKSLYQEYQLVSMNSYVVKNSNFIIKIDEDNKISGNICGKWQGSYKVSGESLTGYIPVQQATCDQLASSIQFSFMFGMQSGLDYEWQGKDLILTDKSRNNIFTLSAKNK